MKKLTTLSFVMGSFVKKLPITLPCFQYRLSYGKTYHVEVTKGLTGTKLYLQPMGTILNAIHDIQELQKGKSTFSDTSNGMTGFAVSMYGKKVEYRFTVTDTGKNRCRVQIEADGDTLKKKKHVLREFALLDAILISDTDIEFDEGNSG